MSRNGMGIYSLPATYNPVVTNTPITIAWANTTLVDIATGITNSIASNGETTITANLPMAGYKHTGVGNASARTDYAAAGQIQDNTLAWGGTAGGTADALTLTLSPVITAYVTGQRFLFISGASPNATTTPTLNVNGVGAKTFLRKDGTTIAAADIPASTLCEAVYNGTNMLLASSGAALLAKLGTVTTGTWNASVIGPAYGGTGVANNAASTITISGAYASTFTLTNTTSVTFPTSGTLLSTAAAVTPAQGGTGLTTLTANNVILGNGTSNVQFVAPGSSGSVLTSNGTTWTSASSAAGLSTPLAVLTPTASTAVNFLTTFSAAYNAYLIIGEGITNSADDQLFLQFAVSGAADTGSNYYRSASYSSTAITTASTSALAGPAGQTTAGIGSNFSILVLNANDATRLKTIIADYAAQTAATPGYVGDRRVCHYTAANAVTGGRFIWSGGANFGATGKIRIYGISLA